MAVATEPLPASFYSLLPLGMALNWCVGIAAASTVLQTLHLARHMPGEVLFMPLLLRHMSPDVLSGGIFMVLSVVSSFAGVFASMLSDRFGTKASCKVAIAVQAVSQLFVAWPQTYLFGLVVSMGANGASQPIFMALFTSQFEDEELTQKLTTYMYAVMNFAFLLATVAAGVQPFWLGYLECAVLLVVSLGLLIVRASGLRDSGESAGESAEERVAQPGTVHADGRMYGYAGLCSFTLLFWILFMQFLGGPMMIFAKERLSPIGGFQVPAQWFLALNGLVDLVVGIPLARMYEHVLTVRFHLKFRICFLAMALAYGVLAIAVRAAHAAGTSPLAMAFAVVFISLGELHYNPVMLAAISNEMPANKVGLCTGIHFMLAGVGQCIAGVGVPAYTSMGPEVFFLTLCGLAAAGAVGLQLVSPCLVQCFEDSKGERTPLQPIKPPPLANQL